MNTYKYINKYVPNAHSTKLVHIRTSSSRDLSSFHFGGRRRGSYNQIHTSLAACSCWKIHLLFFFFRERHTPRMHIHFLYTDTRSYIWFMYTLTYIRMRSTFTNNSLSYTHFCVCRFLRKIKERKKNTLPDQYIHTNKMLDLSSVV